MKNKVLSFYDFFLIAGVIASNIAYSVLSGSIDAVGSIAGIAGVICVVLVAKGSIWNYAFGIINVSMYAYISYKAALYGDASCDASPKLDVYPISAREMLLTCPAGFKYSALCM